MQQHEKHLHKILDCYSHSGVNIMRSDDLDISVDDLRVLEAMHLITLEPFSFGDPAFKVVITGDGFSYFTIKAAKDKDTRKLSRRYWITTTVAIVGAITGIASLVWLIWSTLSLSS